MNEIIKCNKCGHVLIGDSGDIFISFSKGCSITCRNCGNKYVFEEDYEVNEGESK